MYFSPIEIQSTSGHLQAINNVVQVMKYHHSIKINQYFIKEQLPFGNCKGKCSDYFTVGKVALEKN